MGNNYSQQNIATMEMIYGEGYLSAGGDNEVSAVVNGIELENANVLDLGCGLGGASIAFARNHSVGHVTGVDIDEQVLVRAHQLIAKYALESTVSLQKIDPGPLPFNDDQFDLVYLTAVTCHIQELQPFFTEILRVLKPGGFVAGCEWLKMKDNEAYRKWDDLLRERGLNFYFVDRLAFTKAMVESGFCHSEIADRTAEIAKLSSDAVLRVEGELKAELCELLGVEGYQVCLDWSRTRSNAYREGGIGQGHFRGQKPPLIN